MIKKIILLFIVLSFYGCTCIPEGDAPQGEIIKIPVASSVMNSPQAINYMATSISMFMLEKLQAPYDILLLNDQTSASKMRPLFNEIQMFLPIKTVLTEYNYVIESRIAKINNDNIWQITLKDKNRKKTLWSESLILK